MRYPPRLGHLATRPVVVNRLVPTYAQAHQIDEQEAAQRLSRAISGHLWEDLLAATWKALQATLKRPDEDKLLEKVATTLQERPLRYGKAVETNPSWSAFMMMLDLEIGTAGDAARRVMETEQGRKMLGAGLEEAGRFLATELTKGK
ncbi:hypothetical protein [Stigmatella erecta]|uniref:Uncharacterized protein n=1 Tax=Stigmatella erecta TaxID=83460 RepID=A0A1I0JHV9_9BACT|nr:hypothetical protein [Stigmatella erecta]SEU09823.1 hypothetical protein SAMN05443639_107296 [Stigmatella erecta]